LGLSLITPLNGQTFTSCSYYDPPTFKWSAEDGFKGFEVQLSTDQSFNSIPVKVKCKGTLTEIVMKSSKWKKTLLMPGVSGGTVYWRVVGTREDRTTEPSELRSLITEAVQSAGSPSMSSTSKNDLPALSWQTSCNKKFKVWFGNDNSFTKKKTLTFNVADPTEDAFTRELTASQWRAVRKLVGDASGSTIYWKVESWDGLNRRAQTEVMNFVLTD